MSLDKQPPPSSRPPSPIVTAAESSAATVPIDSSLKRGILKSMVQVAVRQTRSFQQNYAGCYSASAFLVNKEFGLFFTAAHAVQGPCEGFIISHNDERVFSFRSFGFVSVLHVPTASVKYKDPEHDYAILQCPPKELEHLDLECLTLKPESALVGSHVYLIGNDSGEKVNILRGTISRLDTPSPRHFDSNVELIQASAAGKGGCSGGPLLTMNGEAIGICVSGHTNSHLDWFFPLDCPLRVLDDIVHSRPVSRGTLHTVWRRFPFYECRQLGLSRAKQAEINTDRNGLLVVGITIPETEAFEFLRVNDILLSIDGKPVVLFSEMEEILNANVGKKIQVSVIRFGQELTFELNVHDLSAITPTRILSDSGATFHDVPYRTAVCWKVPLRGMYLAFATLNFSLGDDLSGYIVLSINDYPTPNVIEGQKALSRIKDRERVSVYYYHATRVTRPQTLQVTIDRHWNQLAVTDYNFKAEQWEYHCIDAGQPKPLELVDPIKTSMDSSLPLNHIVSELKRRFVQVTWIAPSVCLDGFNNIRLESFGFILHNGMVLVAKTACPHDLCDIYIDIDGREVSGEVLHMDHRQNWVILRYDAVNTSTESLSTVDLATETPKELDPLTFVGIDNWNIFHTTQTAVTGTFIADFASPLQHAEAIDVVQIDSDIAQMCLSGGVLNAANQIAGFWLVMKNDVRYVLPSTGIASVIPPLLAGSLPNNRKTFNFRLELIPPKDARVMGVSDEYINDGARVNGAQHRFFSVRRATRAVAQYIRHADILLGINGKLIYRFLDFDGLDDTEHETAELLIVRNGKQMVVDFPLKLATDVTTDRVMCIFGLVFQRPYTDIKYITQDCPSDLITTCSVAGSSGQQSAIPSDNLIVGVNGNRVNDRISFLAAVKKIPDDTDFTIQSEDWNGQEYIDIVRKTSRAFGPYEYVREDRRWKKMPLQLDD